MAAVDMNRAHFWLPSDIRPNKYQRGPASATTNSRKRAMLSFSKAGSKLKRSRSKSGAMTQEHDVSNHSVGYGFKAQEIAAHDHNPTSNDKDDFPSLEELGRREILRRKPKGNPVQRLDGPSLDTSGSCPAQLRLERSVGNSQGTRDSPVMLEDDETSSPSVEAAAVPASVDADIESTAELSKPTDPLSQEAWYDVDDSCYVVEDRPLPLPEKDSFAPALAHDQHLSPGLLENPVNQQNDRNAQCISEELEANPLPQLLDEDSGRNCRENSSGLERDILLEFEARENLSSAGAPGSPRPHHHNSGLAHPPMDQEPDHIGINCDGLEELRHDSPPRAQAEERGPQEQQHQKAVVDAIREARYSEGELERGEEGANCHYQDGGAESGSDRSHDTNDEDNGNEDGDDEELRSAKRRKRHSQTGHKAHHENELSPVDENQQHHISRTFRSPSTTPALNTTALEESQVFTPVPDPGEEWEIRNIVGRKTVGGEVQYLVEWETTWMLESELTGARELIDEFVSHMSESKPFGEGGSKKRRGRPPKRAGDRGR